MDPDPGGPKTSGSGGSGFGSRSGTLMYSKLKENFPRKAMKHYY
jgi:hypothetical protein